MTEQLEMGLIKPNNTVIVRRYQLEDIPLLLRYIEEFMKEAANYQMLEFSAKSMAFVLNNNLNNSMFFCNLAIKDDEIMGGLCGQLQNFLFSDERVAVDNLLYVRPQFRNVRCADKLIASYIDWAKTRKAKRILIGATTGVPAELFGKLLARHGFKEIGQVYAIDT